MPILLFGLSFFMVLAGLNHFFDPEFYLEMMPDYLPLHKELVVVSGLAEIALGIALIPKATRRVAAWGCIVLFISVFPANVNMAINPENFNQVPQWMLYARLPFQFVFLYWAYRFTRFESDQRIGIQPTSS